MSQCNLQISTQNRSAPRTMEHYRSLLAVQVTIRILIIIMHRETSCLLAELSKSTSVLTMHALQQQQQMQSVRAPSI